VNRKFIRARHRLLLSAVSGAVVLCLVAGGGGCASYSLQAPENDAAVAIKSRLDGCAIAWSTGNLDGFMDCFDDNPATLFVGGSGVIHGRPAIRQMYLSRFGAAHGSMG
jgi:hypothetical protein